MKTLVLFVMALIAAQAVVRQNSARSNLTIGYIRAGDRLLLRANATRAAIRNRVQSQDVVYHGTFNTNVTAVRATEIGAPQGAAAFIVAGGVGRRNVTVRFKSAAGRGYNYQLSIWGR